MSQDPLLRCVMFWALMFVVQPSHATDTSSSPQAGARTYA
ncbi:hypothetical protein SY91_01388 [Burkholderia cenocepacia]|nr:hypothetical protein SY91_01388 [Burkholderia cenocepacia]